MLEKVYATAGINTLNLPAGVNVEYRDGFGIAVNYSDKTFDFPLPEGAAIVFGEKQLKPVEVLVWRQK